MFDGLAIGTSRAVTRPAAHKVESQPAGTTTSSDAASTTCATDAAGNSTPVESIGDQRPDGTDQNSARGSAFLQVGLNHVVATEEDVAAHTTATTLSRSVTAGATRTTGVVGVIEQVSDSTEAVVEDRTTGSTGTAVHTTTPGTPSTSVIDAATTIAAHSAVADSARPPIAAIARPSQHVLRTTKEVEVPRRTAVATVTAIARRRGSRTTITPISTGPSGKAPTTAVAAVTAATVAVAVDDSE